MKLGLCAAVAVLIMTPQIVWAEVDPLLSERPVSLYVDRAGGGFYGFTESGYRFTQYAVLPESGVRLHKFTIGQVFFYVSDRGIITAQSDLGALSRYWSLG